MISLAFRYMLARKKQTCFILLGIVLGTCGFVALSSLLLGWREYFMKELISNEAHLYIRSQKQPIREDELNRFFYPEDLGVSWLSPPVKHEKSEGIDNPKKWIALFGADSRVESHSPRLSAMASFSKGKEDAFSSLIGCYPEQETAVRDLKRHITQGSFEGIAIGGNRLAIGEALRQQLNVKLNQTVMVSISQNPPVPFKIAAIFKSKNYMLDLCAYGLLEDVQGAAKQPNCINEIAVKLRDHSQASSIASAWSCLGREKIESWQELFAGVFRAFAINDLIRFSVTGITMLVAGFGIYNVLNMSVVQKKKDIAILQSLGYRPGSIMLLFVSQGMILGLLGGLLGAGFGYVISVGIEKSLPPEFCSLYFGADIYIDAILLGLIASGVSSFFPARFAKKLTPIEIIRSGAD